MDDGWLLTCSGIRRRRHGLLRGDGNGRKDQEKRKSKSLQPNDHDNFSDPGTNQHSTLDRIPLWLLNKTQTLGIWVHWREKPLDDASLTGGTWIRSSWRGPEAKDLHHSRL
jgi:hypothetical protein